MRAYAIFAFLLFASGEHLIQPALGVGGNLTAALTCLETASITYIDSSTPDDLLAASQVWNKLNALTIALAVVSPLNASQVQQAVSCLYAADVRAVPRSGGHSYEGYSVLSDAVTIDLKNLSYVDVNLEATQPTALVGAGTRLGELYYQVSGATNNSYTVVGGTCPPVGVGGFILGGGIGPLSRNYGLGCDQLLSVTLVDYAGNLINATAESNEDIFWASCGGGGGNFGIVVEYELKLVPLPEQSITTFSFTVPTSQIPQFLLHMTTNVSTVADPRMALKMVLYNTDGHPVPQIVGHWLGPFDDLDTALEISGLGEKGEFTRVNYKSTQGEWLDALVTGAYMSSVKQPEDLINVKGFEVDRLYFKYKSFFLSPAALPSEQLFEALTEWVGEAGGHTGDAYAFIELLGPMSAVAAVPPNATAFAHRDALALVQFGMEWEIGSHSLKNLQSVTDAEALLAPFLPSTVARYINYIDVQTPSLEGYYGAALQKLGQVKAAVDPNEYFTSTPMSLSNLSEASIPPSASAPASISYVPAPAMTLALAPAPAPPLPALVRTPIPTPTATDALPLSPVSLPPPPPPSPPLTLPLPLSSGATQVRLPTFFTFFHFQLSRLSFLSIIVLTIFLRVLVC